MAIRYVMIEWDYRWNKKEFYIDSALCFLQHSQSPSFLAIIQKSA